MTTAPGRLEVGKDGKVTGPATITYNIPFPTRNGTPGGSSAQMMGVVMHTEAGYEAGTIATFNNPAAQASAYFSVGVDGHIHQYGPVGKGWEAWAQAAGNPDWYSIEHEDKTHPATPLTAAQIDASAQLVEVLSRFAGFPLQISDSVKTRGYGTHSMGGVPWGNHPACPGPVRAAQRQAILDLAEQIRNPAPSPQLVRHVADGKKNLVAVLAAAGVTVEASARATDTHATTSERTAFLLYLAGGNWHKILGKPGANQVMPQGLVFYTETA